MAENCKILAKQFEAPIKATIAYCALYYFFLYFQAGVGHLQFYLAKKKAASEAKAKGEKNVEKVSYGKIKYGTQSHDKISLTAQRTVGNLMEQAIPFLTSLWLHAVFVSPESAANIDPCFFPRMAVKTLCLCVPCGCISEKLILTVFCCNPGNETVDKPLTGV
eukprot:gene25893-34485_t